ncbi:MAG TPA: hypothetical protein VG604_02655 [Candidatus Saccharimonadales bacterium]|nr:hypothetical protein [Candidatus Saccharimonadales bacterium]
MPKIPKVYSHETGVNPAVYTAAAAAMGVVLVGAVAKGTLSDHSDGGSSSPGTLSAAESLLGGKPQLPPLRMEATHKAHKKVTPVDLPNFGITKKDGQLKGQRGIAQRIGAYAQIGIKHHDVLPDSTIVAFRATDKQGHPETVLLESIDESGAEVPLDKATSLTAIIQKGSLAGIDEKNIIETVQVSLQGNQPVVTTSKFSDGKMTASYASADVSGSQYDPGLAMSSAAETLNMIQDSVSYPHLPKAS